MGPRKIITGVGWVAIALLAVIGAASAIGQIPPGPNSYNPGFVDHPVMTLTHAVPGLIFMVLGPLQFVGGIRNRFLNFHRWSGRIFLVNSVFIGLSGFVIAVVFPFAGLNEQIAIFVFGGAFLVSAGMAYYRIRPPSVSWSGCCSLSRASRKSISLPGRFGPGSAEPGWSGRSG